MIITKDSYKKYKDIIEKWSEGLTIEVKVDGEWVDCQIASNRHFFFDDNFEYRVRPELKVPLGSLVKIEGHSYMVCKTNFHEFCLISVNTGNRYKSPVKIPHANDSSIPVNRLTNGDKATVITSFYMKFS